MQVGIFCDQFFEKSGIQVLIQYDRFQNVGPDVGIASKIQITHQSQKFEEGLFTFPAFCGFFMRFSIIKKSIGYPWGLKYIF